MFLFRVYNLELFSFAPTKRTGEIIQSFHFIKTYKILKIYITTRKMSQRNFEANKQQYQYNGETKIPHPLKQKAKI